MRTTAAKFGNFFETKVFSHNLLEMLCNIPKNPDENWCHEVVFDMFPSNKTTQTPWQILETVTKSTKGLFSAVFVFVDILKIGVTSPWKKGKLLTKLFQNDIKCNWFSFHTFHYDVLDSDMAEDEELSEFSIFLAIVNMP